MEVKRWVEAACGSDTSEGSPAVDNARLAPDFRTRGLAPVVFLLIDASSDLVSAADILYLVGCGIPLVILTLDPARSASPEPDI